MGPRECLGWPDVWEETKQGPRLAMQIFTSTYLPFYSDIFPEMRNNALELFNTNAMNKCWVEKALSGNYRIMSQWSCFLSRITSQWSCWSARAKIVRSQVQDSWESTWGVVFGFERRTKMAPWERSKYPVERLHPSIADLSLANTIGGEQGKEVSDKRALWSLAD